MLRSQTRLPEPSHCDNCGVPGPRFTEGTPPKDRLDAWPYIWLCRACGASVGTHANSRSPLGYMADRETRGLRRDVHLAVDPMWQGGHWRRDDVYNWLAELLGVPPDECHISRLSKQQLQQARDSCKEAEQAIRVANRRKSRQRKRHRKQCQRAFKRSKNHGKFGRTYRRPEQDAD